MLVWTLMGSILTAEYCSAEVFCINSLANQSSVVLTVHSAGRGWAAIGTGSRMSGSNIIMGYKSSSGKITLSARKANGYSVSAVNNTTIQLVETLNAPVWAQLSFSFVAPEGFITPDSNYIWGASITAPNEPDSAASALSKHSQTGITPTINFANNSVRIITNSPKPIVALPKGWSFINIIQVHAYLMILAWLTCPIAGIYIARYLKSIGKAWFILHVAIMSIGVFLVGAFAVLLIILYSPTRPFITDSNHAIVGFAVTLACFIQIVIGIIAHLKYDPTRKSIPVVDKAHWYLGRALWVLALANMFLGMLAYEEYGPLPISYPITVAAMLGFGTALFVMQKRPEPNISKQREFELLSLY